MTTMSIPKPDGYRDPGERERLIAAFRARPTLSVIAKLDLLLRLDRLNDPRVALFLLSVLSDPGEANQVRIDALKRLSDGPQAISNRQPLAEAILQILSQGASLDLRLQAALALAELTDVDGVLTTLGSLALDPAETIDVRYAAFSSLEAAGPTPQCLAFLRQLAADETFGPSAKCLLSRWTLD